MARQRKKTVPQRFAPEIDKRIIDGFLGDQEAMFAELAEAGFGREEVYRRSKTLGLSKKFMAQWHGGSTNVSVRQCLNCEVTFISMGSHLRLCLRCRKMSL